MNELEGGDRMGDLSDLDTSSSGRGGKSADPALPPALTRGLLV